MHKIDFDPRSGGTGKHPFRRAIKLNPMGDDLDRSRPPVSLPASQWVAVVSELRANPDQWYAVDLLGVGYALPYNRAAKIAWQIRAGGLVAFRPAGTFDACWLKDDETDNRYRLFARSLPRAVRPISERTLHDPEALHPASP